MIHLLPYGGLANRMRVLVSGLQLAEETGHKLKVLWHIDWQMRAAFSDLFNPIPNVEFIPSIDQVKWAKKVGSTVEHQTWWENFKLQRRNKKHGFDYVVFNDDVPALRSNFEVFKQTVKNHKEILILSCEEFPHRFENYNRFLSPIPEIQNKIDAYSLKLGTQNIGVHIRRTDNADSIENSPLELFEHEISNAIKQKCKVFLATDDADVEEKLLHAFPNHIIVYNTKNFNRDSVPGVQDAVVDIYVLAKTNHIYGSFWSSFTRIASRINDIPLSILKKN